MATLVPAQKFTTSDPTEPGSMLDQPSLPAKGNLPHSSFTGVPVDRGDQLRSETMLMMPIGLSFSRESKSIKLFLVQLREFLVIDPQGPFFEPELDIGPPGPR